MSGNVYAVLGETELEIIAWLSGLDMRFAANYAEQTLIGRKALLQHTGFAPDEVKLRVLLHAQWCQPAFELARLKRLLDDTEPVAFVLGSGEYRGVFVVTGLEVVSTQTDGAGVAIAFELDAQLREYVGDPAQPNPPGVIAQGYHIPVGTRLDAGPLLQGGPLAAFSQTVAQAASAVGQVADAVSGLRSLVHMAASSPAAAARRAVRPARWGSIPRFYTGCRFTRCSRASAARTAPTKRSISSGLLRPLALSTPELMSTAQGRTRRMPSVTFAGVSPPDKTRRALAFSCGCDQLKAVQSKAIPPPP